jgi:hypothetical protein
MNQDHARVPAKNPPPGWTEDLQEAARTATRLIRAHSHDSNAWVRLIMFEGGDARSGDGVVVYPPVVYHFEASGPKLVGQPQVIVRQDQGGVWRAVLDERELPVPAVTARWGPTQSATEEPHHG